MFLTTQTPLVSIFVFSCFSYLEQFGNMFQAIEQGDVEIVSRLLWHGVSPDICSDWFNRTPLHMAARYSSIEVVQLLIAHKADIEARNKDNQTPLHWATRHNSIEIAQLLISHKGEIDTRDKNNGTPLHWIAFYYSTEVAQPLITHKADTEARDKNNGLPLH